MIKPNLTLLGLQIEGNWNKPLLSNAASLSQAELCYLPKGSLASLRKDYRVILACETGRKSKDIYQVPLLPGRTALVLGNEKRGIGLKDLEQVDETVTIPMKNFKLGSLNVGVAAAVGLYVLDKNFSGQRIKKPSTAQAQTDVLIHRPSNPHELGSLLRSAYAFGWLRIYLNDPFKVWFTKDKKYFGPARKAARIHKNPLEILTADKLQWEDYEVILVCGLHNQEGQALSSFRIPAAQKMLVIYGQGNLPLKNSKARVEKVFVDYRDRETVPCYRHSGSILLSYLSECLG